MTGYSFDAYDFQPAPFTNVLEPAWLPQHDSLDSLLPYDKYSTLALVPSHPSGGDAWSAQDRPGPYFPYGQSVTHPPANAAQQWGLPSFHQAHDASRTPPTNVAPPYAPTRPHEVTMTGHFRDLYSPAKYGVLPAVTGTHAALSELDQATNLHGLSVNPRHNVSDKDAFFQSLDFWQRQNAFPRPDGPGFGLPRMPWSERAMMGITPDDFSIDLNTSVKNLVSPPFLFRGFNLDYGLGLCRVISKYQDIDGSPRIFQIGVITRFSDGSHHAHVFNSVPTERPTHTAWMFREIVGNPHGAYAENWKPFILRVGAMEPEKEQERFPRRVGGTPIPRHPHTRKIGKPRNASKLDHAGMSRSKYTNFTVEQLLHGAVDPDQVAGDLLIYLNEHYKYREINRHFNARRIYLGRKPVSENNEWQKIKKALMARVGNDSSAYQIAKKDVERKRDHNVRAREGMSPPLRALTPELAYDFGARFDGFQAETQLPEKSDRNLGLPRATRSCRTKIKYDVEDDDNDELVELVEGGDTQETEMDWKRNEQEKTDTWQDSEGCDFDSDDSEYEEDQ